MRSHLQQWVGRDLFRCQVDVTLEEKAYYEKWFVYVLEYTINFVGLSSAKHK